MVYSERVYLQEGEVLVGQQLLSQVVPALDDDGQQPPAGQRAVRGAVPDPAHLLRPGLLENTGAGVLRVPLEAAAGRGLHVLGQPPADIASLQGSTANCRLSVYTCGTWKKIGSLLSELSTDIWLMVSRSFSLMTVWYWAEIWSSSCDQQSSELVPAISVSKTISVGCWC